MLRRVTARSAEDEPLSAAELGVLSEAGLAVFAGRVVLDAQPGIDDATLAAVGERCAGTLPMPLVALWRSSFGGRLDYDLRADLGPWTRTRGMRKTRTPARSCARPWTRSPKVRTRQPGPPRANCGG
jgi:hypothetical protein